MRYLLLIAAVITIGFTSWVSIPYFGFPLNGYSQGMVSQLYPNTITPATYAFSIWSLIYVAWLALALAVATKYVVVSSRFAWVFSAAIVTSGLWLLPFHYLYQSGALAIMLVLLVLCLWSVYLSRRESKWVQYPVELYLGWITVATAANIAVVVVASSTLKSIDVFGANVWAIIGFSVATLVHTIVALRYRVYIPGLVLIWALIANMVAHTDVTQRI
jgi:hypothetical protein